MSESKKIILLFLIISFNTIASEIINDNWQVMDKRKLNDIFNSILNITTEIFNKVPIRQEKLNLFIDDYKENVEEINNLNEKLLQQLNLIAKKTDDLFAKSGVKKIIDTIVNEISRDVYEHLSRIDVIYSDSFRIRQFNFEHNKNLRRATLDDFIFSVFRGSTSVSDLLALNHRELIDTTGDTPEFRQEHFNVLKNINNNTDHCDKSFPPQQTLYCLHLAAIVAEIRGFITIVHGYSLRGLLDNENFNDDLIIVKNASITRVADYISATQNVMSRTKRAIVHRCDPNVWIRDESFIEMEKSIQYQYINEKEFDEACQYGCKNFNYTLYTTATESSVITECFEMDTPFYICEAPKGSSRTLEWIKKKDYTYYGRYTFCNNLKHYRESKYNYQNFESKPMIKKCAACICKVVRPQKISIAPQTSNIEQNRVVTGIKFVRKNNSILLQIQEGQLINGGFVHNENNWKEPEVEPGVMFDHNKISWMYLYDVTVPPNYMVTGIRLNVSDDGNGIKLLVQGTKYDFSTGKLIIDETKWFDNEDFLNIGNDLESNGHDEPSYLINDNKPYKSPAHTKFSNTDFNKDAGQTTIPLFDSQSVTTNPAFPLHGVGLYYKGKQGYGGFIAPRILTYNLNEYFQSLNSTEITTIFH